MMDTAEKKRKRKENVNAIKFTFGGAAIPLGPLHSVI